MIETHPGRFPRRLRILAIIGAAVLAAAASAAIVWSVLPPMPNHLITVKPGVLYRSACPKPHELESVIRRYGIRTVVNLCTNGETTHPARYAEEEPICASNGAKFVNLPMIPDSPPSEKALDEWLRLFQSPERLPVLVHCKHGVVRTGEMVAAYEIEYMNGIPAEVWEKLPRFGHDLDKPPRRKVRDFVTGYSKRLSGPPPEK